MQRGGGVANCTLDPVVITRVTVKQVLRPIRYGPRYKITSSNNGDNTILYVRTSQELHDQWLTIHLFIILTGTNINHTTSTSL